MIGYLILAYGGAFMKCMWLKVVIKNILITKWISCILFALLLMISTQPAFAYAPPYDQYLYQDLNYPLVYAHMGYGFYLDKSSVVVLKNDSIGISFAENILDANSDDNYSVTRTFTIWCYKAKNDDYNIYYTKNKQDAIWTKMDLSKEYGTTMLANHAFKLGWETITGYPY